MATWLDPLREAEDIARNVAGILDNLAAALDITGNEHLSMKLTVLAEALDRVPGLISEGINTELTTTMQRVNEATANMVAAALAGAIGGRREAE